MSKYTSLFLFTKTMSDFFFSGLFYSYESFSYQRQLMVFNWSLSDSKSPQITRDLFSILAHLTYAVVCMLSIRPFISKSSSPFINPLMTNPRTLVTIGITATFMFLSFVFFFDSLTRYTWFHLSWVLPSFQLEWLSPLFGGFSFFISFIFIFIF